MVLLTGCTKNFESINTDPTRSNEENFDPNYLFTAAQRGYANITEHELYELSCMVQVLSSTLNYYGGGDKYTQQLTSYNTRFFTGTGSASGASDGMLGAAQLVEAKSLAEKKDAAYYSNLIQMSDIMFVMIMQRITDIYGDIPYSQAGMAKYGIQYPKYDSQQDIYKDMLQRLDAAISKLDASKPLATGDLLYGGNIAKWEKLGYSLMLRVSMRLVKVDPEMARQYTEKAAGKTFTSINDNAIVKLNNDVYNPFVALQSDLYEVRWSKTFIDYLKNNNDPRLYTLTEKSDTGAVYNKDINRAPFGYTTQNPAPAGYINEVPIGMPNGFDLGGTAAITQSPGYPGPTGTGSNAYPLGNYARPKIAVFGDRKNAVPVPLITYAQTELLLAEAKARGWNVGPASAAEHFKNGITAAMQGLEQINTALAVPVDIIGNYVNNHQLDVSSTENSLKMINSEYWVSCLFDFVESWSNYRRSGYPQLVPVNYHGNITNATIPRRLTYPLTENSLNKANYQDALKRMGGSDLNTNRVWWDKQ